jgi:hypothetical protein
MGGLIRAGAWAVGVLVALAAVAYLVFVVSNWNDEPPSADAERLTAISRGRPALADADNGYVHMLGLDAAPDVDPLALGSERLAYLEAPVRPPSSSGLLDLPGKVVDYRAARRADVAVLAAACTDATPCVHALAANAGALDHWLASEQWLLDRYRDMLATGTWREPIPEGTHAPMLATSNGVEIQKLYLLTARQAALST